MGKTIKTVGIAAGIILVASMLPQTAGDEPNMTIAPPVVRKTQDRPKTADSGLTLPCSCIKCARAEGVDIPIGTDAGDLEPNSRPVIGALILLSYPNAEHVAKILAFEREGFLVYECNFEPCEAGTRIVYYIDPSIRGFWVSLDK